MEEQRTSDECDSACQRGLAKLDTPRPANADASAVEEEKNAPATLDAVCDRAAEKMQSDAAASADVKNTTTFKDDAGREWSIVVDAVSIAAVRQYYKWFLSGWPARTFDRLGSDVVSYVNCLYLLCREQANAYGLSDEEFGRMLGGETISRATDAFIAAVLAYLPPKRRAIFCRTLKAWQSRTMDKFEIRNLKSIS